MSSEDVDEMLASLDRAKQERSNLMPTEQDAIDMMFKAWLRLKELGWEEAIYCPKDGTSFDAIEAGSTGIHSCHYDGEWPKGRWWIAEDGDLWSSSPILFRALPRHRLEGAMPSASPSSSSRE